MSAEENLTLNPPESALQLNFSDEEINVGFQEIFRQMKDYEKLTLEIQEETRIFREENERLKENLEAIVNENNRLKSQHPDDPLGVHKNDFIQVTDKIFDNLRNQLFLVHKEKEMFENLWKKTAFAFEKEVPISSITKLKSDHSVEMKTLKEELITAKSNLENETKKNKFLKENLEKILKSIDQLQKMNFELSKKLKASETERQELEKCLEESNELNKEQMLKSAESFEKLQESIRVAEDAMSEIASLMSEKHLMEEECNTLAKTFGEVMESASEKIDRDVEALKTKYRKEIDDLKTEIKDLRNMLELEEAKTKSARFEAQALTEKLKSYNQENTFMDKDLKSAIMAVNETEAKILALTKSIELEKNIHEKNQLEIENLRKIIIHHEKAKEKMKFIIFEVAKRLERRLKNVVVQHYKLKKSGRR